MQDDLHNVSTETVVDMCDVAAVVLGARPPAFPGQHVETQALLSMLPSETLDFESKQIIGVLFAFFF